MACNCIKFTNQALAKRNAQLRTLYLFAGHPRVRLYVETTPVERRRGQKDEKLILPFCPFCGTEVACSSCDGTGRTERGDEMTICTACAPIAET